MGFTRAKQEDWRDEDAPSTTFFNVRNYVGEILGFEVLRFDPEHVNDFKEERPAVRCNVTVCSGDDEGVTWEKEWVEASVLVKALQQHIGDTYVARVVKGGKAFLFQEISDDEWEDAIDVLSRNNRRMDNSTAQVNDPDEPPF